MGHHKNDACEATGHPEADTLLIVVFFFFFLFFDGLVGLNIYRLIVGNVK